MGVAAEDGLRAIEWARRSLPLSSTAISLLEGKGGHHIGIAHPLNAAVASLGVWLVEAGFTVSSLVDLSPPNAPALAAAMGRAGAGIFTDRAAFLSQDLDILLDTNGAHLAGFSGPLKGGAVLRRSTKQLEADIGAPVVNIAQSPLMDLTANRLGVGQASVSGFLDITNLQIAGSQVAVIGYGPAGQGVAHYARAYGARVIVVEGDPLKSVQAIVDGHEVEPLTEALGKADVVFDANEDAEALSLAQMEHMQNGAFLCSAVSREGSVTIEHLLQTESCDEVRDFVTQATLANGVQVKLTCEGKPLYNRIGHGLPLDYADLQIAAQLLVIGELLSPQANLNNGLQPLLPAVERVLAQGFVNAGQA